MITLNKAQLASIALAGCFIVTEIFWLFDELSLDAPVPKKEMELSEFQDSKPLIANRDLVNEFVKFDHRWQKDIEKQQNLVASTEQQSIHTSKHSIKLQAVFYDDKPIAVFLIEDINAKERQVVDVGVGEEVMSYKVIKIARDKVNLEQEGETVSLEIFKPNDSVTVEKDLDNA